MRSARWRVLSPGAAFVACQITNLDWLWEFFESLDSPENCPSGSAIARVAPFFRCGIGRLALDKLEVTDDVYTGISSGCFRSFRII